MRRESGSRGLDVNETRYRLEIGAGFALSPAAIWARLDGIGAWTLCATASAAEGTPGFVSARVADQYSAAPIAWRLVSAGLWRRVPGGFQMIPSRHWRFTALRRRDTILASLRERIYRRDGYRCLRCGAVHDLTLDHIYPVSLGGTDAEDNLQTLCRSCNSSKGATV